MSAPSIFVQNCAHAAVGQAIRISPRGYDFAALLGQGDATKVFLSVGALVEQKSGSRVRADDAMDTLGTIAGMLGIAASVHDRFGIGMSDEKSADLLAYFADRMRHMDWEGRQ